MSLWRPVRSLLWGGYGTVALFAAVPASLFLVASETVYGHLFGLAALCALSCPFLVLWWRHSRKRKRLPLTLAALPVLACAIVLPLHAPPGTPSAGSRVGSRLPGSHGFPRWSLGNLIPEADQVGAGMALGPAIDPLMRRGQARRIRALTMPMYREMEADPDFHALGSVMTWAYRDLIWGECVVGHYYWYVPAHPAGQRLPAILFLHGSCGNFKVLLWAWKRFADKNGAAIVCPSFGFGNWDETGGTEAVLKARERAVGELDIDPDRVWLAGLSNGGLGVTRAALAAPTAWRGLIYLSAVIEKEYVSSRDFLTAWKGRPVLVLHGEADDRIPWNVIKPIAETMAQGGIAVKRHSYPGEDHFLFFSSREAVLADIAEWMRR